MAAETDYLKLIKPENGEYEDVWDEPFNENMDLIDSIVGGIRREMIEARFTKATLRGFLEIGHNPDGTLKATPEVAAARSSRYNGFQTIEGQTPTLSQRLEQSELELYRARRGEASLEASLATFRYGPKNVIVSGSKDINGYPTFMGRTGPKVTIDGTTTPLVMLVGGYFTRERGLRQVTAEGAAGIRYLMASVNPDGQLLLDQDSSVAPPVSATGIISSDTNGNQIFLTDPSQDFTLLPIKAGDRLRVIGTAAAGDYFIKEIAPTGDTHKLSVVGKFTLGDSPSLSGINYLIYDIHAPRLTLELTDTSSDTALCLGEADFDGLSITAVRPRMFGDKFVSEWRAIDVVATPTFEQTFPHGLGSDKLSVTVQVSKTNDGSGFVEDLSHGKLLNTLVGPTGGAVVLESNVALRYNKNILAVKNTLPSHFYRDYAGALQTSGFIRVIVERKG